MPFVLTCGLPTRDAQHVVNELAGTKHNAPQHLWSVYSSIAILGNRLKLSEKQNIIQGEAEGGWEIPATSQLLLIESFSTCNGLRSNINRLFTLP